MKCVNIKLWDILGCFHYILNAPRNYTKTFRDVSVALKSLSVYNYTKAFSLYQNFGHGPSSGYSKQLFN